MKIVLNKVRSQEITVKKVFSQGYFERNGYAPAQAKVQLEAHTALIRIDGKLVSTGLRAVIADGVDAETLRNYAKICTKLADAIEANTGDAS